MPSNLIVYSNNGLSWRGEQPDYAVQPGEMAFPDFATPDQLTAAFPGYAAAVAAETAQADYAARVAAGCAITSTATPALNGPYAIDHDALTLVSAVQTSLNAGKGLPGGGATFTLLDITNVPHTIGAADFTNLATALRDYYYALSETLLARVSGQAVPWPAQPVTIP